MTVTSTLGDFTEEATPPDWFCPWCYSENIVERRVEDGYACGDCEAIQPTDEDWYPELIR